MSFTCVRSSVRHRGAVVDVEWELPGAYHHIGKSAFDAEIENEAFTGSPDITITRVIEEDDVVMAEGTVRAERRAGGFMNGVFCDVFLMRDARIRKLISYFIEIR